MPAMKPDDQREQLKAAGWIRMVQESGANGFVDSKQESWVLLGGSDGPMSLEEAWQIYQAGAAHDEPRRTIEGQVFVYEGKARIPVYEHMLADSQPLFDIIESRAEAVDIKTATGEDLQRIAWLIGAEFRPCPKCNVKGWRVLLFWRFFHRWRCKHEKAWRDVQQGRLRSFSIGGRVKR